MSSETGGAGSRRRGGLTSIQDSLGAVLAHHKLTSVRRDVNIFKAWRTATGVALAKHACAVRFRSGELVVEVDSSAHLHDLANFSGEKYRRRANRELGTERIERIAFKMKS